MMDAAAPPAGSVLVRPGHRACRRPPFTARAVILTWGDAGVTDSWFKSLTRRLRGAPSDPREAERQARLRGFRAAVQQAIASGARAPLEALRQPPADSGLTEEEVELELEMVEGALDALTLDERLAREGLPLVAHQHKALGDERCHFLASVFQADQDGHRTGRLFFTHRRLFFLAAPVLSLPWSRVAALEGDERDLVITTVGGGEMYRFRCNSFSDARCGVVLARALLRRPASGAPGATAAGGTNGPSNSNSPDSTGSVNGTS